jgi:hypothetical protein
MRNPVARREYYNDPQAPAPNSLVVATSAVVTDDNGHILLQRRTDSGNWALPGGGMDMTESLTDSVIREVKEETGFDGEVRRQFNICYTARITGGQLAISDESTEIRFVDPGELGNLPMHHTQQLRISHYLEKRDSPHLG